MGLVWVNLGAHPNFGCPTLGASLYLRLGWDGASGALRPFDKRVKKQTENTN